MKRIVSILVMGILVFTLVVGVSGFVAAENIKVGFAQKNLENSYQKALAEGVVKAAEENGWEVTVLDARNDIINEMKNMETFVSQDYDLIFINVVDTIGATVGINTAQESGVHVIGIDSHVEKDAKVVTNVASPSYENGRLVGNYAAEQYSADTSIIAGILSGNKGNPGGLERRLGLFAGIIEKRAGVSTEDARKEAEAFEEELKSNGQAENKAANFKVVAQGWGKWSIPGGLPAAEDILASNSDLNCLLGENDSMLIGGKQAIEAAGKSDQIKIFAAADGMKEALEFIKADTSYKATGLNDPIRVAAKGVEVAKEILVENKSVDSYDQIEYTEAKCINENNVDQFYNPDATF